MIFLSMKYYGTNNMECICKIIKSGVIILSEPVLEINYADYSSMPDM